MCSSGDRYLAASVSNHLISDSSGSGLMVAFCLWSVVPRGLVENGVFKCDEEVILCNKSTEIIAQSSDQELLKPKQVKEGRQRTY